MLEFSTPHRVIWACLGQAGIALATLQGVAHAQTPTLTEMPAFEVGDKWTFRGQNKGDRKEPYSYTRQAFNSDGASGWYYTDNKNPDTSRKQTISRFDYKRGDVKEEFTFDPSKANFKGNRFNNFQPFDDIFQLPLSIGKKYKVKWDWTNGEGFDDFDVEVEAFEKVNTEAGEFDAYRVKMSGFWNRTKPTGGSTWTGSGRHGRTYWYVPAVKQTVKGEVFNRNGNGAPWSEFVFELVKWEPKAPLDPILTRVAAKPAATAPAPATAASQ